MRRARPKFLDSCPGFALQELGGGAAAALAGPAAVAAGQGFESFRAPVSAALLCPPPRQKACQGAKVCFWLVYLRARRAAAQSCSSGMGKMVARHQPTPSRPGGAAGCPARPRDAPDNHRLVLQIWIPAGATTPRTARRRRPSCALLQPSCAAGWRPPTPLPSLLSPCFHKFICDSASARPTGLLPPIWPRRPPGAPWGTLSCMPAPFPGCPGPHAWSTNIFRNVWSTFCVRAA